MQIVIRKALPADAPLLAQLNSAVQEIHCAAEPNRYKAPRPDEPELIATFEKHLANEKATIFIAEADAEAVGYVLCIHQQTEENPYVFAQNRLLIDQMSVNASHRSKGIGHALMQKAIELGHELKADYLSLGVRGFNEEAIAFYKREGFEILSFNMWQKL